MPLFVGSINQQLNSILDIGTFPASFEIESVFQVAFNTFSLKIGFGYMRYGIGVILGNGYKISLVQDFVWREIE